MFLKNKCFCLIQELIRNTNFENWQELIDEDTTVFDFVYFVK